MEPAFSPVVTDNLTCHVPLLNSLTGTLNPLQVDDPGIGWMLLVFVIVSSPFSNVSVHVPELTTASMRVLTLTVPLDVVMEVIVTPT